VGWLSTFQRSAVSAGFSLLLVSWCGCSQRAEHQYQDTLNATTLAVRRGQFDLARTLTDQGLTLTSAQSGVEWNWRFKLLAIEIRLRKHELAEARDLLKGTPPAGVPFEYVRAKWEFLRGFDQLLEGDRKGAIETFEQAKRLAPEASTADDLRLDIDVYAGVAKLQLGLWEQGEAALNDVLQTAKARGDRYHQAVALLDLGYGHLIRKRYDAALTWLERVLEYSDLREFTIYADALNNAGLCYSRLGLFERAVEVQRQAIERHKNGARREYADALGELGATYILRDDMRTSLPYLRQALDVARAAGLTDQAAVVAGNLSSAYIRLSEWNEAEFFNAEGARLKTGNQIKTLVFNKLNAARIAQGRGQFGEAGRLFQSALDEAGDNPSVQWSAHEGLALVAVSAKRPEEAASHFESALRIIERTRSDLMKTDYKLSYLTRLIDFYRAYVDLLVDQGQVERALEIADSSRGRVLAERQGISTPPSLRVATLRRQAAESGAVFLSYWLAPTRSYLWVVTPSSVQIVTLPPASEIEHLVKQHQASIEQALADPLKATAGEQLFRLLVQPALPSIRPGRRIIIVPDASLYAVNFESLPVPATSRGPRAAIDEPGTDRHYLIEDYELAIAPSLAMLSARPPPAAPARSLLIIGNATARAPDYPGLKFAGAEMKNVARHFSAGRVTSLQGERAVPAAYRDARPDQFSYVHFTAHATANLDSPLDSAVVLSGPDAGFKLYARDVAALPLRAELVTVSACRSAGERTYSGEGLVGFAWAFLRGGARRVVAGLWDVDDQSTAELMDTLYERLADGKSPGQALREAKLTLLRRGGPTARPYYWAPFELFTLTP
jgi:CHAT domain-containing protein